MYTLAAGVVAVNSKVVGLAPGNLANNMMSTYPNKWSLEGYLRETAKFGRRKIRTTQNLSDNKK
jgi:hypothetical protein